VFKILIDSDEEIGLATVYRVLTQFENAGIVNRLRFEDGRAVFELNRGEHHDHMVCLQCGNVEEFVDEVIEQRQKEIADKAGFEMTDHSLYIYGLCKNCRQ
jgi:Fur family ferric uptake transcriptional regulator